MGNKNFNRATRFFCLGWRGGQIESWNLENLLIFDISFRLHISLLFAKGNTCLSLQWRHNEPDGVKSPASRLFTQPFINVQIKENLKAPRHWPLCGEFIGDRWIPHPVQRASNAENVSIWWHHHVVRQRVQISRWLVLNDYLRPVYELHIVMFTRSRGRSWQAGWLPRTSLKTKRRHNTNFAVDGSTTCCHYDNQWWLSPVTITFALSQRSIFNVGVIRFYSANASVDFQIIHGKWL